MTNRTYTVEEIAQACGGRFVGTPEEAAVTLTRIAAIDDADAHSVTWLVEPRLADRLAECKAAAVVGDAATVGEFPRGIVASDPQLAVATILDLFAPPCAVTPGVHPTAVVDATAEVAKSAHVAALAVIKAGAVIGAGSVVHSGVTVGAHVVVGSNCVLYDRCVIYDRCRLGDRVIVHGGAVIGADGFGYIFRQGAHRKLTHIGTVEIEDDVEIGANSCIDRGKVGPTRIGRGTKIDNLCMIAHNVQIGPCSIITAQCGIAGSSKLGAGVIMGGLSGIGDNIEVGDGVRIGGGTDVIGNVPAGASIWGRPADDHRATLRNLARLRRLDKLAKRVAELEKRLADRDA